MVNLIFFYVSQRIYLATWNCQSLLISWTYTNYWVSYFGVSQVATNWVTRGKLQFPLFTVAYEIKAYFPCGMNDGVICSTGQAGQCRSMKILPKFSLGWTDGRTDGKSGHKVLPSTVKQLEGNPLLKLFGGT